MSVQIMGEVWGLDLPTNEQSLLLAMADHAAHDGSNVFPSNGLIAWKLGMSDDTVRRLKNKLLERGILIEVSAEAGRVKCYKIDTSKGVKKPEFDNKKRKGNTLPTPPQPARGSKNNPPATETPTPPQSFAVKEFNPPAELCGTNHQGKEPSKKEPSSEAGYTIPLTLKTPQFLKAWEDWKQDRKARKKPMTARAAELQLADLEKWGVEKAILSIRNSIKGGWQGLFEPKQNGRQQPAPVSEDEIDWHAGNEFADRTSGGGR